MSRLPIEPLDSARWEHIERSLEDRLSRERVAPAPTSPVRRWQLIAAVGTVAVAAAVAVLWHAHGTPTVSASVTRIETESSPSHVDLGGSSLDVAAHSAARIEGTDDTGIVVALDHGTVECEVTPRRDRPAFIVRAGDVTVRVVGTHFRVEHDAAVTRVSVQRGVVEVDESGTTTTVRAGSTWPGASTTSTASPEPPAPTVSSGTGKPPPTMAPTITSSIASSAPPSPRDRFDRALALEASRPDEALVIYRELARGDGPWAMNALYAEGRFELERGNKATARTLFAEYLQRFPGGPNASDARDLSAKLK